MPKKIDPAIQARAERLWRERGAEYANPTAAATAFAEQLGLGKETVRRWILQWQVDSGARAGTTTEELAEIKRLKAENKRLREDVAILKAATTFFAGELDPRSR
ncbi:insertion element IS6110 uncharacterized 12.0 kDa protein [Gordonia crocea]|uniref:Insertion element IS6110 uncharacterized 12.0 kDa protein n=1 Tax=Gordonia crocea TaxID=589162 RepID=A0A7I9UX86_9ACTN|nr:insertion element IS6110 uncharacterized 12.0 kDa protein [Gordonia crocea]